MFDYNHISFIFIQFFNCLIPLLWLGLSIATLFVLKKRSLGETSTVLWAILICVLPILGALAFWIISPKGNEQQDAVG